MNLKVYKALGAASNYADYKQIDPSIVSVPGHTEVSGTNDVDVYVPPPNLALSAAACAFVDMSNMKQLMAGGSISITVTCPLATFRGLYDLLNDPSGRYIHDHRGKKNAQGVQAGWGPEDITVKSAGMNMIIKSALALTMQFVNHNRTQCHKSQNDLMHSTQPCSQLPKLQLST